MKERKASDILLELEKSVKNLEAFISNIDLTNKLILKNQQMILEKLNVVSAVPITVASKSKISSIPSMPSVEVGGTPAIEGRKHIVNPSKASPVVELSHIATKNSGKKTTVVQRVAYSDGKNVLLAQVEIYDSSKKLLKKTRTNSSGKWNALLEPGEYTVSIQKSASAETGKPSFSNQQNIYVSESEAPITLDTLQV